MPLIYGVSENCLDLILNILLCGIWFHKFEKQEKDSGGLSVEEMWKAKSQGSVGPVICLRLWPNAQNSFKWRILTPSCSSEMVLEKTEGAQSISGWELFLNYFNNAHKKWEYLWIMVVIYSRKITSLLPHQNL